MLLGLLLFINYWLDHPFGNQLGVTSEPFEQSLSAFDSIDRGTSSGLGSGREAEKTSLPKPRRGSAPSPRRADNSVRRDPCPCIIYGSASDRRQPRHTVSSRSMSAASSSGDSANSRR